ncbi:diguanylate cyclase [Cellulomonas cellasea]|uniref:Diguanylate cyclase (GGDEF)-like protein n=1 Tax=Cellulomonas cellasea TaxID=43670 RepID=A0A7W4UI93_9CELL|nr:diguanylate cyclase [Cellulomonas cellasea]MBB2924645.1 diguanylate cyclase (GGDEF)-like protein [Cellulomonas cellasea]
MLALVYALVALVALVPALTSWRHRARGPAARPLTLLHLGIAWWSAADAVSVAATDPTLSSAAGLAIYPGVCAVIAGFLWQALVAAGHAESLRRRHAVLLAVVPVLTVAAAATDPWHHLFYASVERVPGAPMPHVVFGPLFWVHSAYSYALSTVATVLLVHAMRRAIAGQRRTFVLLLLAAAAPTVGNLATITGVGGNQTVDLTPMLFLVTAVSWWLLDRRWGQGLALPSLSARQVLAALGDAAMVLDPWGRFLDLNPAAVRLLERAPGPARSPVIGARWQDVLGPELAASLDSRDPATVTTAHGQVLDVRVTEILSRQGRLLGFVAVARDVTELEHLRADLADQASRDALTHVHNRRHLAHALATEVARSASAGTPLTVVMVDLDHFKRVNDTHGHAVGDELLVFLATTLASSLRGVDVVARYGGEEFVVVMPGADVAVAARRAEEWRAACATATVPAPGGRVGATISLGVAQAVAGDTPESLLRRADDALYRAKSDGRDRVVVAGPGTSSRALAPAPSGSH